MATYSLYQAWQFSLKSRWNTTLSLAKCFFSPPRNHFFQYQKTRWPELSSREFPFLKPSSASEIQFLRRTRDLDSWRQRTCSILRGRERGARKLERASSRKGWEIRILWRCSLRVIHRESRCIERIIVFKMKILNIRHCYLRVTYINGSLWSKIAEPNSAWEMDSFSRRRLKYNFLVRKLRTTCLQASRFDRRLFGCNNDLFESKSIESFERKNIFLNRIERKILNI